MKGSGSSVWWKNWPASPVGIKSARRLVLRGQRWEHADWLLPPDPSNHSAGPNGLRGVAEDPFPQSIQTDGMDLNPPTSLALTTTPLHPLDAEAASPNSPAFQPSRFSASSLAALLATPAPAPSTTTAHNAIASTEPLARSHPGDMFDLSTLKALASQSQICDIAALTHARYC
ncbi:hypothetical protein Q7P37_009344 [Cladosporium fusiforme]